MEDARRRVLAEAAGLLVRDERSRLRAQARAERAAADAKLLAATATGATDRVMDAPLPTPERAHHERVPDREGGDECARHGCDGHGCDGGKGLLNRPLRCYVCKEHYRQVHHFYHLMCPRCAEENLARRTARTDLTGRRALLTGGRVKIGHQVALMLLRDGAELTVTTRFPQDAVRRFAAAPDAADWWDRLRIAALDLRDPRQVLAFTDHLLSEGLPLDILINNAAQTLHRSPQAYAALAAAESTESVRSVRSVRSARSTESVHGSPAAPEIWCAPGFTVPGPRTAPLPWTAELTHRTEAPSRSALPDAAHPDAVHPGDAYPGDACNADVLPAALPLPLPRQAVDEAGLLPDTAAVNSWTLRLGQVDPAELLEVQLVNAVAPFLLADRLLPLMDASPHPYRYLINVSAVEGQFAVREKSGNHPHTNMAKAALNMLTRTSAADLAARGIHTCSVDTGWVTDEKPLPFRERRAADGWRPPLDVVDGAARVYHPIVQGQAGAPVHGVLLKDYRQVAW
ncbi:SDR family NAD(P)-dependent oxidoreductase [Streptomyces sp. MST-110588]|uniref:SDR family NAD(P)-dependent oxidoreductase n=1 Tax=Streptomyces sp. MST-110588 TaxID=2833628 RepID=UPI001F5D6543|nr:SDR family NAD(P)-dependent oxidoreductase [Streptomyces sp. MST-110588]UNO44208.1 SDR family NAD(P)-dependent oxidoreductase [Streptomyces sp. MST-110588]